MKPSTKAPLPIAIIEDNRFTRDGLSLIFDQEDEFELLGSYDSCEAALNDPRFQRVKLMLLDLRLSGLSGSQAVRSLLTKFPHLWIIICTAYEDDEEVFRSIAAGAIGFISKKSSPAEFLLSVRNVISGGSPMTPNLANQILQKMKKMYPESLTELQLKVLKKIATGESYRKVAASLGISELEVLCTLRTVYNWIHQNFNKQKI